MIHHHTDGARIIREKCHAVKAVSATSRPGSRALISCQAATKPAQPLLKRYRMRSLRRAHGNALTEHYCAHSGQISMRTQDDCSGSRVTVVQWPGVSTPANGATLKWLASAGATGCSRGAVSNAGRNVACRSPRCSCKFAAPTRVGTRLKTRKTVR